MKEKVRLDEQGKVSIPSKFQKKIGIRPGQKLTLELEDGKLVIRKIEEEGPDLHELAKRLSGE